MKKNLNRANKNALMLGIALAVVGLIGFLEAGSEREKSGYFAVAPVISNIKPDEFQVSWTIFPEFNDKTHYQVQLNHSLYGSSQKITGTTVRRLQPGGTYDVAVVTYHNGNVAGVSSETRVLMAPASPAHINIYDVGSASFKIIWQQVNTALKYRVYRFPDVLLAEVDEPANKAAVYGLTPGEKVLVFMTAINQTGESYKSEPQEVQLLPPPPVLSIIDHEIGQNWFGLKWNSVENASAYVIIVNDVEVARVASDTFEYRVENLPVGTAVSVKMKAENASGLSEESEPLIVQLLPATPVLAVVEISSFSCTLQWSVANGATYYKIYEDKEWCLHNLPASINQVTINEHINPGSTATYTVKAGNGTGESEHSLPVVVTFTNNTRIEPPAAELLPNLLQISSDRLSPNLRGTPLVSVYFPIELDGPELALEATWLDQLASLSQLQKVRFFGVFTRETPKIRAAKRLNLSWKSSRKNPERFYLPGNLPLVRFYDSDGFLRRVVRVSMLILTPEDIFREIPEAFEQDAELIELYREEKNTFENLHREK